MYARRERWRAGGRQGEKGSLFKERCGINFTDPSLSSKGGETRRGGNPLSQKVVGVKNSPPLTPISKIPLMGDIKGLTYEWISLWKLFFWRSVEIWVSLHLLVVTLGG